VSARAGAHPFRDSASIDFVEAAGNTPINSFWMKDTDSSYLFEVPIRKQF